MRLPDSDWGEGGTLHFHRMDNTNETQGSKYSSCKGMQSRHNRLHCQTDRSKKNFMSQCLHQLLVTDVKVETLHFSSVLDVTIDNTPQM